MGSLVPDDDYSNGNDDVSVKSAKAASAAIERQAGGSMMEQLVPEITTHALSYLDYPSLCRLSMTNSSMRRAANDDNAWKMLYHKVILRFFFYIFSILNRAFCVYFVLTKLYLIYTYHNPISNVTSTTNHCSEI